MKAKKVCLNILTSIIVLVTMYFLLFLVFNLSFSLLYKRRYVEGQSMQPTLNQNVSSEHEKGDIVYINPNKKGDKFDIVVTKHGDIEIIKRLVGTPGDKIQIVKDVDCYRLIVNNNQVYSRPFNLLTNSYYERYLTFVDNPDNQENIKIDSENSKLITLGDDQYFVMGDNWGKTDDSLVYGTFSSSQIVGKVDWIIKQGENKFVSTTKFMFYFIFKM